MRGAIPLALAGASLVAGIAILLRPEWELGRAIGALLVGFALALGVVAAARIARGRIAIVILATYLGAALGAIASRLALGFRPQGIADALPWLAVLLLAGPVLALGESPLFVAGGAVAGLCSSFLYEQRRISPPAD